MEKYTVLELLGEGSYGKVLKCRHNESGALVAIKKFIETEEDSGARKVALREIRMLKRLHHPNLVCLLEVFRRKKRFHLVFEHMTCSLLEEMESQGSLPEELVRKYMYQIIRGVDYCHCHNIIHRDIKPENILISDLGIVKICDFGFARFATVTNEPFTDYVATRWYRPPELLVGEINYGRAVDIWALGCIQIEMLTGDPLFPGNSDIDQLYQITKLLGSLTESQKQLINKHGEKDRGGDTLLYQIKSRLKMDPVTCLRESFPDMDRRTSEFAASCLRVADRLDPDSRLSSEQLLRHTYFSWDLFLNQYIPELQKKIQLELSRRVSVSDMPCHTQDSSYSYSFVPCTRRPSRITGWNFSAIGEGTTKENTSQKEGLDQRKSSSSMEPGTPLESSTSLISQRLKGEEQMDWKDVDRWPNEMPKISLEFKRNMMPNTQSYLRPVKGSLHYDKFLTAPCNSEPIEKPQYDGIYLPLIKTMPVKKSSDKTKVYQLKRKKSAPKEGEKSNSQIEVSGDYEARNNMLSTFHNYHFPDV